VTAFVRIWLPALVVVGGVLAIALGPADIRWEGGLGIVAAGLAIWLINLLFRMGATGDRERDAEEEARAYFDRHGRWPGE